MHPGGEAEGLEEVAVVAGRLQAEGAERLRDVARRSQLARGPG